HFGGIYGDTLVLANTEDDLRQSLRVLGGRAANLAGSKALPLSSRQGVFVFVAIGDRMLGAIQKTARAKMLQLSMRSLVIDVAESAGQVTATAHAEMRSADAGQKATSILEGLRAMASLSDDPMAHTLLDGLTVTSNGSAVEVVARLPASDLDRMIQHSK
ncbi:MAG TPA: hypothetical protein VHW23_47880, partial [Kofleriaceae bacterium]|nr:hypothetical protein [Kofleriaceae bacterium]